MLPAIFMPISHSLGPVLPVIFTRISPDFRPVLQVIFTPTSPDFRLVLPAIFTLNSQAFRSGQHRLLLGSFRRGVPPVFLNLEPDRETRVRTLFILFVAMIKLTRLGVYFEIISGHPELNLTGPEKHATRTDKSNMNRVIHFNYLFRGGGTSSHSSKLMPPEDKKRN